MLGHPVFDFETTRKYVCYFGTVFNDITIKRFDNDGVLQHVIPVPVNYIPIEKALAAIEQNRELFPGRPQAATLPRISFEIVDFQYDASRALPGAATEIWIEHETDNNKFKKQYFPVPWNVIFRAVIWVKNVSDGTKIVEQILPFFKPDWTAKLELIEGSRMFDIPIVLNPQMQYIDDNKGTLDQRRMIAYSLTFTLKGYYFGPVMEKPIIKFTTTNFRVDDANNDPFGIVTIRPGLDANGSPTTVLADSVPLVEINVNDDYGFIEIYEGGPFEE